MNWEKLFFWFNYLIGRTPWDTNVTPPELVRTIQGPDSLPPGRAIDLGCGTGTNVIYLARHGWRAVGVDFVSKAISEARQKAQAAQVDVRFYKGDVTQLDTIEALDDSFDLALDIGCLHSLQPQDRVSYAHGVTKRLRPGATYLLYAWGPRPTGEQGQSVSPEQVETLFTPPLHVTRVEQGKERGRPSAWYWLEKQRSNTN